jgi:hypothetical protein
VDDVMVNSGRSKFAIEKSRITRNLGFGKRELPKQNSVKEGRRVRGGSKSGGNSLGSAGIAENQRAPGHPS